MAWAPWVLRLTGISWCVTLSAKDLKNVGWRWCFILSLSEWRHWARWWGGLWMSAEQFQYWEPQPPLGGEPGRKKQLQTTGVPQELTQHRRALVRKVSQLLGARKRVKGCVWPGASQARASVVAAAVGSDGAPEGVATSSRTSDTGFSLGKKDGCWRLLASETGRSACCFLPWVLSWKLNKRVPWQLQSNH